MQQDKLRRIIPTQGYYPVYYEIEYTYGGENMTENGVSYVWLLS